MLASLTWLPYEFDRPADAAAVYGANGWQVFPCVGKHPITSDGFKGATSDLAKIAAMWATNPSANIGWALPPGWFALDVDPRHGGDASLAALQAQYGPLPWTLRANTGGGGDHWIYRIPEGMELRQAAGFKSGLDTRLGGRGYLLIAPSIHPDTGSFYRWHTAVEPELPPAWLTDLVKVPKVPPRAPYIPPAASAEMDKRRKYALAALRGVAQEVREAGKGQRNSTLNRAWYRMAQFRDAIDRSEAEAALLDAALAAGLSDREARAVLR